MVSALCTSEEIGTYQNYYTSPVTRGGLGKSPLEWTVLSYVLEYNQDVDLELWRLPDSYQSSSQNPVQFLPDFESEEPEEFLRDGTWIGYLNGYKIEDHIEEDGEGQYKQKDGYPPDRMRGYFLDAIKLYLTGEAETPERERVTMNQEFVIGHEGQPIPEPEDTPQTFMSVSGDSFYVEPPTFSMWGDKIANYFLWDGLVCDKNGEIKDYDYSSGSNITRWNIAQK